jgi:hypothetical protein
MSDSGHTLSRLQDEEKLYRLIRYMGPSNNVFDGCEVFVLGRPAEIQRVAPFYGPNGGWLCELITPMTPADLERWKSRLIAGGPVPTVKLCGKVSAGNPGPLQS